MRTPKKMYGSFIQAVWTHYREYGRHDLPWRLSGADGVLDPYRILVSELMLQQTQVPRVIPKFNTFLSLFPDVRSLADAPLGDVLIAWQGLGYNRRARYLWQAAQAIVQDYNALVPNDQEVLVRLPGIGENTAAAIRAYAFNAPVVFIETNIRTVFIHHFFNEEEVVTDAAIRKLVELTLDPENPREWYWALMDYGSQLKQTVGNKARASTAYTRQSRFEGSSRQLRGRVLRLIAWRALSQEELLTELNDERAPQVLAGLERDGLIRQAAGTYRLP